MRLLTFTVSGRTRAGFEVDGSIIDLAGAIAATAGLPAVAADSIVSLLEGGESAIAAAKAAVDWAGSELAAGRKPAGKNGAVIAFARGDVRLNAPIPRPGKIICLGLNYADHAAESGTNLPSAPMFFAKFANAIVGTGDNIILPKVSTQMDYEAEFAFVIGKKAKHVALEDAMSYVAGYMNLDDVSARDLQSETTQFYRGKGGDTWAPCGPYLVTKDEVSDPHALSIKCFVNGELMQNSNTRYLIFNVPFLIHQLTKTVTLDPGDLISTGTPSGVGNARKPPYRLKAGDVVRVEVEGLGVLENTCVDEN
jgi:acylpyruvate hydrolase